MELIISPGILYLDEPTTGLDASTANKVLSLLRRYLPMSLKPQNTAQHRGTTLGQCRIIEFVTNLLELARYEMKRKLITDEKYPFDCYYLYFKVYMLSLIHI